MIAFGTGKAKSALFKNGVAPNVIKLGNKPLIYFALL